MDTDLILCFSNFFFRNSADRQKLGEDTQNATHKQDQNKTFRTRLVGVWLLSNAALAISIQTLNGFDRTSQLVQHCLDDTGYNLNNGTIVVPVNGTCIENALSQNSNDLQDKQQVYFKYLLWATFGLSAVRFIGVSNCPGFD